MSMRKTKPPVDSSPPLPAGSDGLETRGRNGSGSVDFTGTDNVIKSSSAGPRERFEAFARSVRDILSQRWVQTDDAYERDNPKRLYYLSMEFLIGRSLANNVTNLLLDPLAQKAVQEKHLDW